MSGHEPPVCFTLMALMYFLPTLSQYGGYGGYGGYPGGGQQHSAAAGSSAAKGGTTVFNPLAPISVEKLNSAYMARQLPWLTGSFAKMPRA